MAFFSIYAHLTPTSHPTLICDTLKLTVNSAPMEQEEESKVQPDTIDDLVTQVREFLTTQRNDGNKLYEILAVSTSFMGAPLPLGTTASNLVSSGDDVYVTVRISIDMKKHIAPISSTPIAVAT